MVFDSEADIYQTQRIDFDTLSHLESIGLIQFEAIAGFIRKHLPKSFGVFYYDKPLVLEMPKDVDNELPIGKVRLTKIGHELAPICGNEPVHGFWDYVTEKWKQYLAKSEQDVVPDEYPVGQ